MGARLGWGLVLAVVLLAPTAANAQACGGNGQRACCWLEASFGACRPGLTAVSGCSGACRCGGSPFNSSQTCIQVTACGGAGQRACCFLEASFGACVSGLTQIPGCTGNCFCSGGLASSSGSCIATTACGSAGQRACCVGETLNGGNGGGCRAGTFEQSGCTGVGSCFCGGGIGGSQSSSRCIATTPCGGVNQRACCLGERAGGACNGGLTEVPGCGASGNACRCGGATGASSSSRCIQTTPCGGAGQRACCIGETLNGGNGGGCSAGLAQQSGCNGVGDCTCGGGVGGTQSSSRCTAVAACGGVGQRACCLGERAGGACNGGLTEVPGCSGNCLCAGNTGASASGRCVQTTACGGANQRACCVGETLNGGNGGGCNAGLAQVAQCLGVGDCTCGGGIAGTQSSSRCLPVTACGGAGQRACCVGERAGGACNAGLTEVPGCQSGNCFCAGSTGASSSSRCVQTSSCGGVGQRACCVGETLNGANGGGCNAGLGEVAGCTGVGDCTCGGGLFGSSSSSRCVAVTACGGAAQRACCIGEGSGICQAGLTEVPGCLGDCQCAGAGPTAVSSGTCTATTPCGGEGQRACCAGEGAACRPGLTQLSGCAGNCFCAGGVLGSASSGTCRTTTTCGAAGERACCLGETQNGGNGGGCDPGLLEVSGCADACACTEGVLGAQSSSSCQVPGPPTPCGAAGQRACCGITGEGPPCQSGLVQVAGCAGNCLCGGANASNFGASGTCHAPAPCGGEGQRACCLAERTTACDPGLLAAPGCAGDCFCGASATGVVDDDGLGTSSGTCIRSPVVPISEPAIGLVAASGQQCTQMGYADLHMHLFADIAHGGGVLAGHPCPRDASTYCSAAFAGPLSPGGCGGTYCAPGLDVNSALNACYGTSQDLVTKDGAALPTPNCPPWLPGCGSKLFHGDHTLFDDAVGAVGTGDGAGDSQLGAPAFSGWPQWSSTTHQQAYYKWLERSWRGGLRLIVQMAVTNTALCLSNKHLAGVDCSDSMAFIDQQLQAAYDFENFIDLQVGNGTDTNSGWFRIVKTPAEARQVLAAGKLAVVLGVEVDNPFNCAFPREQCVTSNDTIVSCNLTDDTPRCKDPLAPGKSSVKFVREQVDRYYDVWGVRHMFPIHNFDNSFGGAATWQDVIEVGNRFVEGHWYNSRDCSAEGYSYKLGSDGTSIQALSALFGFGQLTTVPFHPEAASCNAFGLFPLGRELVTKMMQRGMIIDVDHMSARAFDDTAKLAEQFRPGGYPLAASHALFTELHVPTIRHERMRTEAQVARLKALGGMVGVMLKDDTLDRGSRGQRSTLDYAGTTVVDDCRHSSKTFAQALALATDRMGTAGTGSDFDGVAGHFAPRFGSDACGGNAFERSAQLRQGARLGYPFTLSPFGTLAAQRSGTRTFDYNTSGLAHLGLMPDFVADLAVVGLEPKHLDPLLRSADAYIRMWERAEGRPVAPLCTCGPAGESCTASLSVGGWPLDGGQPAGVAAPPVDVGARALPVLGEVRVAARAADGGALTPQGAGARRACGCTHAEGSTLALLLAAMLRRRTKPPAPRGA